MSDVPARWPRNQTLLVCADVEASGRWYRHLLDLPSGHGGDEYERIGGNEDVVLQLHAWDPHDHGELGDRRSPSRGNGVVVWFQVQDFDAAVARAGELGAEITLGPQVNAAAQQRELWLRDPDGYAVVLAGLPGDLGLP